MPILRSTAFKGLFSLTLLSLNDCQLHVIEYCAFCHLNRLKHLNLSNNKIRKLYNNLFSNLFSLKYLSLVNNSISFVQQHTFENLNQLEHLFTHNTNLCCYLNITCNKTSCTYVYKNSSVFNLTLLSTIGILFANVFVILYYTKSSKRKAHFILIQCLSFHDGLIAIIFAMSTFVQSLEKEHFIFTKYIWFNSIHCTITKLTFLHSQFMSKIILGLIFSDNLILTKYVLKKRQLNNRQVFICLLVSSSLSGLFLFLFTKLTKQESLICFPFNLPHVNSENTVLLAIWCSIQLIIMCQVLYCSIEIVKAVSENNGLKHHNNHRENLIIRSILTLLSNVIPILSLFIVLVLRILGYKVTQKHEIVLVTFIMPFPTLINSLLHTMSQRKVKKIIKHLKTVKENSKSKFISQLDTFSNSLRN